MTDHVTHLTAKTVRHIFGWTIISTVIGGVVAALVTAAIRSHNFFALSFGGVLGLLILGVGLVSS
jgi:hypothetical protein